MKFGIRTPSLKRSLKARTTGKLKRKMKSAVNPLYGKKGMGYINNPKKAIYNKVYNKTTIGSKDLYNKVNSSAKSKLTINKSNNENISSNIHVEFILCLFLGFFGAHKFYKKNFLIGLIYMLTFGLFLIGWGLDTIILFFRLVKNKSR